MAGLRDKPKSQMYSCVSQGSDIQHKDKGLSPRELLWLVQPSSGGFFQQGVPAAPGTWPEMWALLP